MKEKTVNIQVKKESPYSIKELLSDIGTAVSIQTSSINSSRSAEYNVGSNINKLSGKVESIVIKNRDDVLDNSIDIFQVEVIFI